MELTNAKLNYMDIVFMIGGAVFAIGYLIRQFKGGGKARDVEKDNAEQTLIKTLQGQVSALDREITLLREENKKTLEVMKTMQLQLTSLQTERDTLKLVLEGKDESSKGFNKALLATAENAKIAADVAKESTKALVEIHQVLVKNGVNIEKLLIVAEKEAGISETRRVK